MKSNMVLVVLFLASCLPIAGQVQAARPATPSQHQAGDAAGRKQLAAYMGELGKNPDDAELRYKIIELAKTLKPAPPVPLAMRTEFAKAMAQLKSASAADDFKTVARLFERVAARAPWYAEAYYSAASAYDKAGEYDDAERNLALYAEALRPGTSTTNAANLQRDLDQQRFQQALQQYQKSPSEQGRAQVVKLAQQVQPPPEVPAEARQYYSQAKAVADRAGNAAELGEAVKEFNKALALAPWWSEASRDLGVAAQKLHFQQLTEKLRAVPRYSDEDRQAREEIIKMVLAMPPPPPTPDDVLRAMVRAQMMIKQGNSFQTAVNEMEQAVLAAPWLADGYFNLALVQEKAEMFEPAIQNLKLCILAAPQSPNLATVKTKMFELEMMKEQAVTTQNLQGEWKNADCSNCSAYTVKVEANKIRIDHNGETAWDLVKSGRALQGTTKTGGDQLPCDVYFNSNHILFCYSPTETALVSGSISEDGQTIELTWMDPQYKGLYRKGETGILRYKCDTVVFTGKEERTMRLRR